MSIASTERLLLFLRRNRNAIGIVSAAFVIQLLTMRAPIVMGEPFVIARNLMKGLGYSYPTFGHTAPTVTCYIPPLYAWISYAIMWLGGNLFSIQIFNLLCLAAAEFVLFRFARRFLHENLALISLVAICCYFPLWIFAAAIEPDALNVLLLALTIDLLCVLSQRPSWKLWRQFGLLIGIQLLVRPDIIIGAVLFSMWLFVVLKHRLPVRERFLGIALSACVALLIVLPWTVRNYVVFHTFVLVSANSGFNFWMGNNSSATGEFALRPFNEAERRDADSINGFAETHDQVAYDQNYMRVALGWIEQHPMDAFVLDLKKIYYHWWRRDLLGDSMRVNDLTTYYAAVSLFLIGIGFYGLAMLKSRTIRSLLLTLFFYSTSVSVIFFVQSRHRTLKVDPFLLPLAVAGAYVLYERIVFRKRMKNSGQEMISIGNGIL